MGNRSRKNVTRRRKSVRSSTKGKRPITDVEHLVGGVRAAARLVRAGMAFVNAEEKFSTASVDGAAIGTAATFTLLNGISQGDDNNNRNGRSLKAVALQYKLTALTAAGGTRTTVRHLLVWDTQANGAAPAEASLFSSGITVEANALVPDPTTVPDRYVIIADDTFCLDINGQGLEATPIRMFNFGPWGDGAHVLYSGTGATVASISKGSLYSVWVASDNVNKPVCSGQYRFFYLDN